MILEFIPDFVAFIEQIRDYDQREDSYAKAFCYYKSKAHFTAMKIKDPFYFFE